MSCFQEENDLDDLRAIFIPRNSYSSSASSQDFWARQVVTNPRGTRRKIQGIVTSFHVPNWTVTYTDSTTVLAVTIFFAPRIMGIAINFSLCASGDKRRYQIKDHSSSNNRCFLLGRVLCSF
jgi:hypothetical protein